MRLPSLWTANPSMSQYRSADREGQMKARLALAAAVMMILAGPALAQSKEAIQKLNDEWAAAFNTGDAGAVVALYTADAYVLPAGADGEGPGRHPEILGRPDAAPPRRHQADDPRREAARPRCGARDRHRYFHDQGR